MTREEETALMGSIVWIGHAVIRIMDERMRDVHQTQTLWRNDDQHTLMMHVSSLGSLWMERDPYNERSGRK